MNIFTLNHGREARYVARVHHSYPTPGYALQSLDKRPEPVLTLTSSGADRRTYEVHLTERDINAINEARARYDENFVQHGYVSTSASDSSELSVAKINALLDEQPDPTAPTDIAFGRRVIFARGMTAEVTSKHQEWLDELERRVDAYDNLCALLNELKETGALRVTLEHAVNHPFDPASKAKIDADNVITALNERDMPKKGEQTT